MRTNVYLVTLMVSGLWFFAISASQAQNALAEEDWLTRYERGTFLVGFTFGLSERNSRDVEFFDLDIDEAKNTGFNVRLTGGYFLKRDLALGLNLEYEENKSRADYDASSDYVRTRGRGRSYMIDAYMRNYIPLSDDRRWALFNETHIAIGFGADEMLKQEGNTLTQKYNKYSVLEVGMNPGVVAFIKRGVAFEASVGLLGLRSKFNNTKENGVDKGEFNTTNIDLKINILRVNLGIFYYF
ncbi:hypothetical protein FUAX_10570 [Fulvitalea axinellae]|uniref:Outer membrane protein beta-barrel domain-containing protein n=1 Tax=Fulvitalea axinellae TaxID=1182444 RepID=A0AAU9D8N1_9BACT|nr:hypothetical protein FUAX_10570 [Fulvitalea axinellae]